LRAAQYFRLRHGTLLAVRQHCRSTAGASRNDPPEILRRRPHLLVHIAVALRVQADKGVALREVEVLQNGVCPDVLRAAQ